CQTQAYRCAIYLRSQGRGQEAHAMLQNLAANGALTDRPWAEVVLSSDLQGQGDLKGAAAMARDAIAIDPNLSNGWAALSGIELYLGHDEAALAASKTAARLVKRQKSLAPPLASLIDHETSSAAASLVGDYVDSIASNRQVLTDHDF